MYGDLLGQPPGPQVGAPPSGAAPPPPVGIPPGAALGVGQGAPPKMPGMPPPPTNVGAMPTGDPSTNRKEAADNAVLALRELKGHYPALGTQIEGVIDQIKSVAKAPTKAPPAGLGEPTGANGVGPEDSPSKLSGGLGGF